MSNSNDEGSPNSQIRMTKAIFRHSCFGILSGHLTFTFGHLRGRDECNSNSRYSGAKKGMPRRARSMPPIHVASSSCNRGRRLGRVRYSAAEIPRREELWSGDRRPEGGVGALAFASVWRRRHCAMMHPGKLRPRAPPARKIYAQFGYLHRCSIAPGDRDTRTE